MQLETELSKNKEEKKLSQLLKEMEYNHTRVGKCFSMYWRPPTTGKKTIRQANSTISTTPPIQNNRDAINVRKKES